MISLMREYIVIKMSNNKKNVKKSTKINPMAKLALQRLQKVADEEAKLKAIQEEEERKIKEENDKIEAEKKKKEEMKAIKKQKKLEKIKLQKIEGTYLTKSQKKKANLEKLKINQLLKHTNEINTESVKVKTITETINVDNLQKDKFRSLIICVLGHVNTGKTKLLDNIRNSNVQDNEEGGITQQIGATFISKKMLIKKTNIDVNKINMPGVMFIDTPGHKAFENLRLTGSQICDIAIVVVDMFHGLQVQTINSMQMLKDNNIPFVVALNKIDRLYGWKKTDCDIQNSFNMQDDNVLSEFDTKYKQIMVQIMEQGFNVKLCYELKDEDTIEDELLMCPISAITGEGVSDLLKNIINYSQKYLNNKIMINDKFKCTVMDSNKINGIGQTIDAILINGELNCGDNIQIITAEGNKITTIVKNILIPPMNHDSKAVKDESKYDQCKNVKGTMGIKIVTVNNIDNVYIGSSVTNVSENTSEITTFNDNLVSKFNLQEYGVSINASTLGSLEALLFFLQKECVPPVPVFQANVGNILKKEIVKAGILKETLKKNNKNLEEYNIVLGFDVDIEDDAVTEAKNNNIKIFTAKIMYQLFDQFTKYKEMIQLKRKEKYKNKMIFPCVLKILSDCIFNKKNPLIFGVEISEGNLHIGTKICTNAGLYIGKVISIQKDHKELELGKKGQSVCVKLENEENPLILYGRQFDHTNILYSKITRESLDILKEHFRDDITKDDLILIVKLKKLFGIK